MEHVRVAVVGGGQAGLAVSHELTVLGVEHAVLERGRVGQTWRDRWDSFCLVTPNWTVQLPGGAYDGLDPDGFMLRDEIVSYLEGYASGAPVREGVDVESVERGGDGFVLRTSDGDLAADVLVVATGTYRRPHLPAAAGTLPGSLLRLTVDDYRSPQELPDGAVLVVGSGQSGCQLAEELHESGREVVLACGRAPWSPRRSAAGTSSGGSSRPASSMPAWNRCRGRRRSSSRTYWRPGAAAATISTCGCFARRE